MDENLFDKGFVSGTPAISGVPDGKPGDTAVTWETGWLLFRLKTRKETVKIQISIHFQ